MLTDEKYPAGPLVKLVEGRGFPRALFGPLYRSYYRGKSRGYFPLDTADRLAHRLGHHIEEIWPSS